MKTMKMFDVSWIGEKPMKKPTHPPAAHLQVWMFRATCASEGRRNPKWIGLESKCRRRKRPCNFSSGKETNIWRFKHHFGLQFTMNSATKTWYDDIIDLNRNIQAYKSIDFFGRFYFLSFELTVPLVKASCFFSHTWAEVDLRPSWGKFHLYCVCIVVMQLLQLLYNSSIMQLLQLIIAIFWVIFDICLYSLF